jgi:hypothetical protein
LGSRVDLSGSLILLATLGVAFVNWLYVRRKAEPEQTRVEEAVP